MGLAACAGILFADWLIAWPAWLWLAIVLPAAWLFHSKQSLPAGWLLCAAVFAFVHHTCDRDPLREQLTSVIKPGGAVSAVVTGVIQDQPEPDATGTGFTFPLRIESLQCARLPQARQDGEVYVRVRDFPVVLHYGDRIRLTGLLRRSEPPRNPGEFDFVNFLRRQGFSAEFESGGNYDHINLLTRDAGNPVIAAAQRSRQWIGDAVTLEIRDDPNIAATIRAMVLGTREKTPQEVEDAFVASGAMHVFAVSGLHIAMFGVILWTVLRALRIPRSITTLIILPAVFYYVFITGLRPSAWRAAVMCSMVMLGIPGDRKTSLLNSLGAAALLLLSSDTQQLFQPGFTLSFGVLLAIAVLYGTFRRLMEKVYAADSFLPRQLYSPGLKARLAAWDWTANSLAVSMASTIGSALLMIHYFSLVTPVGIVANLFLVFLSLCILVIACAALTAAAVKFAIVQASFNHFNVLLASFSVWLAKVFAAMPLGHIRCDASRLFRGDLCELTVLQLDGGGAAVHLDTPEGKHWLIDVGGLRHYLRTVRPHLSRTPVHELDGLVLSHRDTYHSGAAGNVRSTFRPQNEPELFAGMELYPDKDVRIRCLFPPRGYEAVLADNNCRVFLIETRRTRILLMNDAGFLTEKALLEGGEDLRADILVKGWHSDDYSGLPEFLNAVLPRAVVFTSAAFPAGELAPQWWKEMAALKGFALFDQSRAGAVVVRMEKDTTTLRGWYDRSTFTVPRPN